MKQLPRLELTEDPNKKNDFIIYRKEGKHKSKKRNMERKHKRTHKRKHRKSRKSFFNLF